MPMFSPRRVGGLLARNTEPAGLLGEAGKQYPLVKGFDGGFVNSPIPGDRRKLEFWPADEEGDAQYPRPKEFPMGRPGVQVISPDTTPSDVAGDIVSHQLVKTDPLLRPMYQQFANGFNTPQGQASLREDYARARQHGETRPLAVWAETDRIPAYFRGYVFKQWAGQVSDKEWKRKLSQEQIALLDRMSSYVEGQNTNFRGPR